ncbi:MAG TPA: MDR family MFS transporter [Stellaceae bacterium]|nr:MDR family MFS transporter [Stellaceae bacterium]
MRPIAAESPTLSVGRRRWIVAACCIAIFMVSVESSIVATAMPSIVAAVGGFEYVSWVFAAYLLSQAVAIPIYGRLADLWGRKWLLIGSTAAFLVGTLLCSAAWGMIPLVIFRFVQGAGGGGLQPLALTIIGDLYPPVERVKVQGNLNAIWGVSALSGPLIGAVLTATLGWRSVFWINVPPAIVMIAILWATYHEQMKVRQHSVDYLGSLLLVIGVGALLLTLVQFAALNGETILILLGIAALALGALAYWEVRAPEPIVPLELWRNPIVSTTNIGSLAIGMVMMGVIVFVPPYVQGVMGRSPVIAGFALISQSLGWTIVGAFAGRLLVKVTYRTMAVWGGALLVVGSAMLIALDPQRGASWAFLSGTFIGFGIGFCNTTFLVAAQNAVDWQRRGAATSGNLFMRQFGASVGAALLGGVINWALARRIPEGRDAIDQLMDPGARAAMPPATLTRLSEAIAASLTEVYVVVAVLAVISFALCFLVPAGQRTQQH